MTISVTTRNLYDAPSHSLQRHQELAKHLAERKLKNMLVNDIHLWFSAIGALNLFGDTGRCTIIRDRILKVFNLTNDSEIKNSIRDQGLFSKQQLSHLKTIAQQFKQFFPNKEINGVNALATYLFNHIDDSQDPKALTNAALTLKLIEIISDVEYTPARIHILGSLTPSSSPNLSNRNFDSLQIPKLTLSRSNSAKTEDSDDHKEFPSPMMPRSNIQMVPPPIQNLD